MAKVALSFDAWKAGAVQPATVEVPVHVIEAVESAQLRATLKGHEDAVWQVAWAPDGKTLATLSSARGEVKLCDVAGRKDRATLRSDLGGSYGVAFAPDGKTLVVGHHKHDARLGPTGGLALWDVATGQRKGLLQHTPPRGVAQLAVSPDGKTIAAVESWKDGANGAYRRCVTLWDLARGEAHAGPADEAVSSLAFSPDGKVLARTAYIIKGGRIAAVEVRRRDVATGQELPALANPASTSPLNGLAFSADGRTLAGADYAGTIVLWDTASGKVRATLTEPGRRRVTSLAFAPDGQTLAAAVGNPPGRDHEPGLVTLWDVASGQRRLTLTGHTNEVLSVAFSPDGRLLASGGSDRSVRLWDLTAPPATRGADGGR
jgi:WD40 repeat protein